MKTQILLLFASGLLFGQGPSAGSPVFSNIGETPPIAGSICTSYNLKIVYLQSNPPSEWLCVNIAPKVNPTGIWVQSNTGGGSGSGTVGAGTTGQFGYYSSGGTAIAGRTLVAGDIPALSYDASGAAAAVLATSAQKANNLSDLSSAATARANLGLGSGTSGQFAIYAAGGTVTSGHALLFSDISALWTGTASSTTFARGDGTWAVPAGGSGSYIAGSSGALCFDNCVSQATGVADIVTSVVPRVAAANTFTGLQTFTQPVILADYTVSTLPTCSSFPRGFASVHDATSPTYNATLTGGGSVHIPVFCDGTSWTAH